MPIEPKALAAMLVWTTTPIPDWAYDAADRILDIENIEMKVENWNKDATRKRIASIIVMELPKQVTDVVAGQAPTPVEYREHVAYIPVPRCETCQYFMPWNRLGAKMRTDSDRGDCQRFLGHLNGIEQSFGCVQWKEKG